jgi:histidinol-phosphate aminotransferase
MKIGIQKSGRLALGSIEYLKKIGIEINEERIIAKSTSIDQIESVRLRSKDISRLVGSGDLNLAIVGEDCLLESGENVFVAKRLGFSKCSLNIAAPKKSDIKVINDLQNKIIATSYPRMLKNFCKQNNIICKVIEMSGSVEAAPRISVADAVCDLVQSGKTLEENDLQIITEIKEFEAILIASTEDSYNEFKKIISKCEIAKTESSKDISKYFRKDLLSISRYPAKISKKMLCTDLNIKPENTFLYATAENETTKGMYKDMFSFEVFEYPDPYCLDLKQALSKTFDVSPSNIAVGNGSDELLDVLIALFRAVDAEIIICPPAFGMYEFLAKIRGVNLCKVDRLSDFSVDITSILGSITEKTKAIIVDSPGNPTGKLTRNSDIRQLLKTGLPVVVDEAYFEFSNNTAASMLVEYSNLIIVRTFSKWAGLAGLRVGYLFASSKVIDAVEKIKPPYNVNVAAQKAAIFALNNRKAFLSGLKKINTYKKDYASYLANQEGMATIIGSGAYIAVKKYGCDSQKLYELYASKGVITKKILQKGMSDYVLLNVSTEEKLRMLLKITL